MKKSVIGLVILGVLALWGISTYNKFPGAEENIKKAWADVQKDYQRRYDLIDGMVNTAKGVAKFEQNTLTAVIEARAKATSVLVDAKDATPEQIAKFNEANGQLQSALKSLLLTVERYPDLKANKAFENVQVALEGSENRVARSRELFNEAVQQYNTMIRKFPTNLIAGITGFKVRQGFEAEADAQKAKKVDFSDLDNKSN